MRISLLSLRMNVRTAFRVLLVAALVSAAAADLYMHNPPGSNDRNRERNDNRNNGNRLFDSQNNGKGGYAWRGDPTMRGSLDEASIPDPITYYVGSTLRVEWTAQHACGPNPNIHCQVVIQYGCHDPETPLAANLSWLQGLRDGYPMTTAPVSNDDTYDGYYKLNFLAQTIPDTGTAQNQDGTTRIPDNAFANDADAKTAFYYRGEQGGMEFGMHEGVAWYDACKLTTRNKGLYTSDQKVNLNDARGTRQNPNGDRNGLECPEERDYYPYWRPAPWRDVAVLTSNTEWCSYFKDNSQNVVDVGYCTCNAACRATAPNNGLIPITEAQCTTTGGTWQNRTALGGGAPDCQFHMYSRDNHLGNALETTAEGLITLDKDTQPETAYYNWVIPEEAEGKHCVLRMRYNMSTFDYPSMQHAAADATQRNITGASYNCPVRGNGANNLPTSVAQGLPLPEDLARDTIVNKPHCHGILATRADGTIQRPIFERPYINLFNLTGATQPRQLAIALNTDQTGRTFQDRSHVFKVAANPKGGATVINLNVRGRRGNIVQCYPAVEYDFVPNRLDIRADDWVHIQLHGSDFNEAKNANNGEGWRYSDRHNLVEVGVLGENYPLPMDQMKMFSDPDAARFFALLEQTNCGTYHYNGDDNERTRVQNQVDNCAQLNRAPQRFPRDPEAGLVRFAEGTYNYVSTRNNNFSNRSHKAKMTVGPAAPALTAGEKAAVAIGVLAAAGVVMGGGLFYGKKHPESALGGCFVATAACATCQSCRGGGGGGSTSAGSTRLGHTAAPDMDYQRH